MAALSAGTVPPLAEAATTSYQGPLLIDHPQRMVLPQLRGRRRALRAATWQAGGGSGVPPSVEGGRAGSSTGSAPLGQGDAAARTCLRCGEPFAAGDNSPTACRYHGHTTGDRGMFALAPPHQGVDGEWSEASGVIVYRWHAEGERPNTGRLNWKRRWTCCGAYGEDAPPCRAWRHVTYDDGATLFG